MQYIVKIYTNAGIRYFNGIYMDGVHKASLTSNSRYATLLSAFQANDVGNYYLRVYRYKFDLERI